jgi:undecaprenyl-diphosphatase
MAAVFLGTYLPYLAVAGYGAFLVACYPERFAAAAFIEAVLAGAIARLAIGSPLRYFFPRSRPHKTHGLSSLIREESLSLPSGHALFFFAFAVSAWFVAPWAGIALFLIAAIIGAARVAAGVHYPSDIALGALIGSAAAAALYISLPIV